MRGKSADKATNSYMFHMREAVPQCGQAAAAAVTPRHAPTGTSGITRHAPFAEPNGLYELQNRRTVQAAAIVGQKQSFPGRGQVLLGSSECRAMIMSLRASDTFRNMFWPFPAAAARSQSALAELGRGLLIMIEFTAPPGRRCTPPGRC